MNENVRDMDESLKDEIKRFFIKMGYDSPYRGESYRGEAQDFVDELEQHLKEKGFDLGCVLQYKNK